MLFNGNKVQSVPSQKHLRLVLDSKHDFNKHINNKKSKCNKTIGATKNVPLTISWKTLLIVYKSFARPSLDYAVIIYGKFFNESFKIYIKNNRI